MADADAVSQEFPKSERQCSGGLLSHSPLEVAVNFAVLILNWLHLRRTAVAPSSICLGAPLNRLQWRIVRQMEATMEACNLASPVTSKDMGRTAGKISSFEEALDRLTVFETVASDVLQGGYDLAGKKNSSDQSKQFSRFAPGLRKASAGDVLGALDASTSMTAKPIVSDRLQFRGEPAFDPSSFLDAGSRKVFQSPMAFALRPEESVAEVPSFRIHCSREEKMMKLFRKLDQCGRLGMVAESDVYSGYQAGLFSVSKDESADRMIFDSRPFNSLEVPMGRSVRAMSSIVPLLDIQVARDEVCICSGTDLRDFYCGFLISPERLSRNSLVGPVDPKLFRKFRCYRPEFENHRYCYLALNTLAMGDTQAGELAQTAHIGILVQAGLLDEPTLVSMDMAIPRENFFGGVVIDDLVLFEIGRAHV